MREAPANTLPLTWQNYPDIAKAYCQGDITKCDMAGLQWHWTNRGQPRGMSSGCSTDGRLRCYAQNYPNIYRAYCSEPDDPTTCELSGVRWHWFTVGEKQGMTDACPDSPQDSPVVGLLRRVGLWG